MLVKRLLHEGSKFDIYVLEQDGVTQVSDFIGSLLQAERSKLSHSIDFLKDHGLSSNNEKFKNEGNGIYALKTTNARVYGFFHGPKCFVLAFGFLKNKKGGTKVERRYCAQAEDLFKALS